ncbi:putative HTH-type DNA-binding domain-containing acetyltransferase YbfA [Paramyrothecium foliicola]|nr:putative HTH-type DNA-binding domain-containing acetyltransferase YbfA [Paramyrothecium foliicola]
MSVLDNYVVRHHRPGDMGLISCFHASYYASKYRYNSNFEAFVCRLLAEFVQTFDPSTHCCWIVESNGVFVASIIVMPDQDITGRANIRTMFVVQNERNKGIGKELLRRAIDFTKRAAEYQSVSLYTEGHLVAAETLFRAAGFILSQTTPKTDWGPQLTSEIWKLDFPQ